MLGEYRGLNALNAHCGLVSGPRRIPLIGCEPSNPVNTKLNHKRQFMIVL